MLGGVTRGLLPRVTRDFSRAAYKILCVPVVYGRAVLWQYGLPLPDNFSAGDSIAVWHRT
jgi:hypothetical protein